MSETQLGGTAALKLIAELLPGLDRLTELTLNNCEITTDEATLLFESLHRIPSLQIVNLAEN